MFTTANEHKNIIEEGDAVLLYAGRESIHTVVLKKGDTFCHKVGAFRHDSIIGKSYGSKITSVSRGGEGGYCYVLKPTPEFWSNGPLVHRTQIIYPLDISQIIFNLEITPSKVVVESGTGSGSLSIGFARALYPTGKLNTFEFHEERSKMAREQFKALNLSSVIDVHHQDVCANGFSPLLPETVDAVFLDLPSPWLAVDHAHFVLKQNGNFCSFSPCIEQVQLTCDKLRQLNFNDVRIIETLLRPIGVTKYNHVPFPTDNYYHKNKKIKLENDNKNNNTNIEMKDENQISNDQQNIIEDKEEIKNESNNNNENNILIEDEKKEEILGKRSHEEISQTKKFVSKLKLIQNEEVISCRPASEIRGHTSYLIFARKSLDFNAPK